MARSSSNSSSSRSLNLVFFDLETTGLVRPDILQVGAVNWDASDSFDDFARPGKPIEPSASGVNRLVTRGNGDLYKLWPALGKEQRVHSRSAGEVLARFVDWLRDDVGAPVALVAYNGHKFDAPVLLGQLDRFGLEVDDVVATFVDPFVFVRDHGIDGGGGKRSQKDLMETFKVRSQGESHNAVYDAEDLRRLTLEMSRTWPGLLGDDTQRHFASTQTIRERVSTAATRRGDRAILQ
jgi:DNA polymerase III epsilon subunit-like protein